MHCGTLFLTEVFLPALTSTSSLDVVNEVRGFVIATGMDSRIRSAVAVYRKCGESF